MQFMYAKWWCGTIKHQSSVNIVCVSVPSVHAMKCRWIALQMLVLFLFKALRDIFSARLLRNFPSSFLFSKIACSNQQREAALKGVAFPTLACKTMNAFEKRQVWRQAGEWCLLRWHTALQTLNFKALRIYHFLWLFFGRGRVASTY